MRHSKSSLTALVLSGFFVACGGGEADSGASTPAAEPAATPAPAAQPAGGNFANVTLPDGVTMDMVQAGADMFPTAICVACHGPTAVGLPSLGPDLTDDVWLNSEGSYAEIIQTINEGVATPKEAAAPMPPKGGNPAITEEQVGQLAAYLYALANSG